MEADFRYTDFFVASDPPPPWGYGGEGRRAPQQSPGLAERAAPPLEGPRSLVQVTPCRGPIRLNTGAAWPHWTELVRDQGRV